jgi:hypothetical protein
LEEGVAEVSKNQKELMKIQQESMQKLEELLKKAKNVAFVNEREEMFEESIMDIENVMFMKEATTVEVMLMDTGCPQSLVSRSWLEKYLEKNKILMEDLKIHKCSQKFHFGPSNVYESMMLVELPITVRQSGVEEIFKKIIIKVFVVDAENVPLLCGKNTMKKWKVVLDMNEDVMDLDIDGRKKVGCIFTAGGHLVVPIHQNKNWNTDETVYMMNKENDVESFAKIKKIHEMTNHKGETNLLHAYRNTGKLMDKI